MKKIKTFSVVKPMRITEDYWRINYDTDKDGVPDYKDCKPLDPKQHSLAAIIGASSYSQASQHSSEYSDIKDQKKREKEFKKRMKYERKIRKQREKEQRKQEELESDTEEEEEY